MPRSEKPAIRSKHPLASTPSDGSFVVDDAETVVLSAAVVIGKEEVDE